MPPIGWVGIGSHLEPGKSEAWIAEQADRVCGWWGEDTNDDVCDQVRAILTHAIAVREDESVMELLYFPVPEPYAARVRVMVCDDNPLQLWRDAGLELDPYVGSSLGPGVQCVAMRDVGDANDPAQLISAAFVFEAEEETVIALIEPTTRQAYALMIDGLAWLLSKIEVRRPNGELFCARPVDGFKVTEEDEWALINA